MIHRKSVKHISQYLSACFLRLSELGREDLTRIGYNVQYLGFWVELEMEVTGDAESLGFTLKTGHSVIRSPLTGTKL